jgi:hypothetical protein
MKRITWKCAKCGKPIDDDQGSVRVLDRELHDYKDQMRTWEEAHPGPEFSLAELADQPEPVRWMAYHDVCDPDIEASSYEVGVERWRTAAQALHWAAHLMEKAWAEDTDLSSLLRIQAH